MVFEHIKDPLGTLTALTGALSPGGVIRIAVPDSTDVLDSFSQPDWVAGKDAAHPLEHINCFTPETLRALGADAGLLLAKRTATKARGLRSRLRAIVHRQPAGGGSALYFCKQPTR